MKILFAVYHLPGHINPAKIFQKHLEARGHEVLFSSLSGNDNSPADLGTWFDRFFSLIKDHQKILLRLIQQHNPDALLTDPAIFAGSTFSNNFPWAIFGNLPIFIPLGDFVTYLQASIPSLEPNFSHRKRYRFIGPMVKDPPPYKERLETLSKFIKYLDAPVIFTTQGMVDRDSCKLLDKVREICKKQEVNFVCSPTPIETIMPYAHLFITNGGFHGVNYAISHGVPMILAGATEDKEVVSQQIETAGAGINLKNSYPSVLLLSEAITTILGSHYYRDNAKKLQKEAKLLDINKSIDFFEKRVEDFWERRACPAGDFQ